MAELKDRFTFIVSDESLNKYGSRVMTSGIDLEEFKANPVMFWNHRRDDESAFGGSNARERMPIGRWENIRQEGGRLIADAVLDLKDTTGAKVARKIEDGFIKAASIGIGVLGVSESPEMMLNGQTRPTISASKLLEISIVDVGANSNALKLSFASALMTFDSSMPIGKLNEVLPIINHGASLANELNSAIDNMVNDDRSRGDVIGSMASAAGIAINTVQNILSENIDCPPLARLSGFASVLTGVSVDDLRGAAERDGCEYGENNKMENMTIQEQINNGLNEFFDKMKATFNFTPKEGVEAKPESAMADLFVELNASLQTIEIPTATDNSGELLELKASIEKLNASNEAQAAQVEEMKNEIIEFRGKKGGADPTADKAPVTGKEVQDVTSQEDKKFAALGDMFTQKIYK